ncbi:MAG: tetratricopeptide repeat protein [Muribaculaceae bacterium]|nr:tetratricopeptide repeat protein [Muribaculaceae bacterium]
MKLTNPSHYTLWLLGGISLLGYASQPSVTPESLSATPGGVISRASTFAGTDHWQAASDQLRLLSVAPGGWLPADEKQRAAWLRGLTLYGEGDPECVAALESYISLYPDAPNAVDARLLAADWYFFDHQYSRAFLAYSDIDFSNLAPERRDLYTYRKMLSMLKCGFDREAVPLIAELEKAGGKWELPAIYYRAYTDYRAGDYDAAYSGFERVAEALAGEADEAPAAGRRSSRRAASLRSARATVPYESQGMEPLYYMVQIDFTRGHYREVIDHGQLLLDRRRVPELVPEIWRVMGLSHFKLGEYAAARGLLESYVECPDLTPASDAVYALGAIEYADCDYKQAAARFSTLTDLRNDLAQGAYLYLGQCAAREGDGNAAAMAFEKASRMAYDPAVGETAMYNYIAAQTRGGKIPFSSSIALYEQFLADYPHSRFNAPVRESLASAYYNERDYPRALASIDRISNPSPSVCLARQKILYELGMEQLARGESREAVVSFNGAVEQKHGDPALSAQASLWLGDALYDTGAYAAADRAYAAALKGGVKGENAALATYDRAYALYMQNKFGEAASLFRTSASDRLLDSGKRADARVRLADCLYYAGDYSGAEEVYDAALDSGEGDADYAAWRVAVMRGLQGDTAGKIKGLSDFARERKNSRWTPRVLLELGETYMQGGDAAKAISTWERIVKDHAAAPENRTASLLLARAYMDGGRTSAAENAYKRIMATWPSGEEADAAHEALKRHYASTGKLDEYAAYLHTQPGGRTINVDEMDTLTFEAAEAAYVEDDSDVAMLKEYITSYPEGRHVTPALLYLMRSASGAGRYDEAISLADRIIRTDPGSPQAVEAIMEKAGIIEEHYPARRKEALEAWRLLERAGGAELAPEAWSGIMRTTDSASERVEYARRLAQTGGITAAQAEQARLFEALGMLGGKDSARAEETLALMARNPATESGARAAVELGEHYLATSRPAKAVTLLSEFTDTGSPHGYWLARGFISLADAYAATGQKYLAVEYLKSLRDNYPGNEPDIHEAISTRLKKWK